MNDQGWVKVKARRKLKSNSTVNLPQIVQSKFDPSTIQLNQYDEMLKQSKIYHILRKFEYPITCLGLGTLSNRDSRVQLQLLLLLGRPVAIFDPIFSMQEQEYFRKLEFQPVLNLKVEVMTVFFMIHCPHSLYVRVVQENRDCLESIMIIGNSFNHYRENGLFHDIEFDELPLSCLGNTFYNTSLMSFGPY